MTTVGDVINARYSYDPYRTDDDMDAAKDALRDFVSSATSKRNHKIRQSLARRLATMLKKLEDMPLNASSERIANDIRTKYDELFFHPAFGSYLNHTGTKDEIEEYKSGCQYIRYSYGMNPRDWLYSRK